MREGNQQRVRIKMCGTTRDDDVRAAVAAGVDALGFIFVAGSPRQVSVEQAAALIDGLPPFIGRVGVFRGAAVERIKAVVDGCGLTQVQLHGDETPDFCRELRTWRRGVSICKAFRVGGEPVADRLADYRAVVDSVLLDTYVKGTAGGTGRAFDWSLVNGLRIDKPLILAGGLRPENVVAAIRAVAPYAIDINSGVESAPGRKDHERLRLLIGKVRQLEASSC